MKTLYLIRHSLTEGNERHWYYGAADLPLSEKGRALCVESRDSLALPDDVRFATTGMLRTEETLWLLFGDVPHEILPDLREMNLGKFEMHTYDELKDDADFQQWISDVEGGDFIIPGGEGNALFSARVVDYIRSLIQRRDDHLLVVCHGGTIRRVMCALFPDSGKGFFDWRTDACHGFAIHIENGKPIRYEPI